MALNYNMFGIIEHKLILLLWKIDYNASTEKPIFIKG